MYDLFVKIHCNTCRSLIDLSLQLTCATCSAAQTDARHRRCRLRQGLPGTSILLVSRLLPNLRGAMPTKAEEAEATGGAAGCGLPPATAPTLAPSEQLEHAWSIATALPLSEREELHRRITDSLPAVVTAEAIPSASSQAPPPGRRPAPRAAWWRRLAATAVDTALLQMLLPAGVDASRRMKRRGRRLVLPHPVAYIASILVYLVYHLGAHAIWPGQTLGKKFFGIQVRLQPLLRLFLPLFRPFLQNYHDPEPPTHTTVQINHLRLLRISIEMASFLVVFSIEKAAISIEIRYFPLPFFWNSSPGGEIAFSFSQIVRCKESGVSDAGSYYKMMNPVLQMMIFVERMMNPVLQMMNFL